MALIHRTARLWLLIPAQVAWVIVLVLSFTDPRFPYFRWAILVMSVWIPISWYHRQRSLKGCS